MQIDTYSSSCSTIWKKEILSPLLLIGIGLLLSAFARQSVAQVPSSTNLEDMRQAMEDVRGPDLQGKDGPLAKIGINLAILYRDYEDHLQKGKSAGTFTPRDRLRSLAHIRGNRVVIDAIAAPNQGTALLADLRGMGLVQGAQEGRLVSGQIPIERLNEVAALASMHSARLAAATTTDGKTVSQGDAAMLSDDVRASRGLDGAGMTVGVLSDTYNNSNSVSTTAQDDIESGDLPPLSQINILDDTGGPGIDEGRAMMQIIHDVAPGASLAFHTAFNGQADFAQGIRDLANAGSNVIVDDIIYFAEPMFQDGVIAQAADDVNSQGVAYFSSAGNTTRQSYASDYRETSTGAFDFNPSSSETDTTQTVTIPTGDAAGPISF